MERLPVREFRRLDLNSQELGVPVRRLMGRAGKALARAALSEAGKASEVWFLCGKGNNGGDGFAAAGLLIRQGLAVRVWLLHPRDEVQGEEARSYLDLLPDDVVQTWRRPPSSVPTGTVLVDCMLGSGIKGAPRPPYGAAIRWLNRHRTRRRVVACDVPSGLGTRLAVRPHVTVTFHAAKEGMTRTNSGRIEVADIGIPKEAQNRIGLGDLAVAYPVPRRESHKGQNGVVLVVAGGPFTGAPWFAAMGALRAGADLALVATPPEAARTISTWGPDPIVHAVGSGDRLTPAAIPAVRAVMDRAGAVVLGPGLGDDPETRRAATQVLSAATQRRLPVVVDADGLDAVTSGYLRRNGRRTVLTPHGGEFKDLAGMKADDRNVAAYARRHRTVVLRKGAVDVVSDGATTRWCHCGHPAMTVGGTGDVLAGVVGALLAKGADPFEAACAAAYTVGSAGQVAAAILGPGLLATDVHEAIPAILRQL